MKLHIGCGSAILPGWTNIDILAYDGVDRVLDVREGLPFHDVDFIFAEHFIEHLDFRDGLFFLKECRRVLKPEGILRLSTPNLDWVWENQYHPGVWTHKHEAVRDCFWMNKAFRGWGHQFLYNVQTLSEVLMDAGFALAEDASFGESKHQQLRNLESHDTYPDTEATPHIVVLEASGLNSSRSPLLKDPLAEYVEAVSVK